MRVFWQASLLTNSEPHNADPTTLDPQHVRTGGGGAPVRHETFEQQLALVQRLTRDGRGGRTKEACTYDQQHDACEKVLAHWALGRRWVILCAQMQCGKTGVMRHIGWLLNRSPEAARLQKMLRIPRTSSAVTILQHLSDTQLLDQTQRDLQGVVDPSEIFHSARLNGKNGYEQKLARRHKALLLDESHWGAGKDGRVDKAMEDAGMPMSVDLGEMSRKNFYVLSVSATPVSEGRPSLHQLNPTQYQPTPTQYQPSLTWPNAPTRPATAPYLPLHPATL